ncbi:CorA metal ion transporter [Serendipita sp. 399]|nr:CorA metal ion transporter [Serendipita sp. 399]
MASPTKPIPVSPRLRTDVSDYGRTTAMEENASSVGSGGYTSINSPLHPARLSPTIARSYDPTDPQHIERQRAMDADFAMQLSRARSASIALARHPSTSPINQPELPTPPVQMDLGPEDEEERGYFSSNIHEHQSGTTTGVDTPTAFQLSGGIGIDPSLMMNQAHDPGLLVRVDSKLRRAGSSSRRTVEPPGEPESTREAIPEHQEDQDQHREVYYRSRFDFSCMEAFAAEERTRLGLPKGSEWNKGRKATKSSENATTVIPDSAIPDLPGLVSKTDEDQFVAMQKPHGQGHTIPRKSTGKLAQFESANASLPPLDLPPTASPMLMPSAAPLNNVPAPSDQPMAPLPQLPLSTTGWEHERSPFRFSFYSNSLRSTIHARSLCELPADGQTFEELFMGKGRPEVGTFPSNTKPSGGSPMFGASRAANLPMDGIAGKKDLGSGARGSARYSELPAWKDDEDAHSWWLDILCATDEEMRTLSKCFGIHPLTAEDIQMEETREKIELFRNYYLFHFRQSPHPQNVRRRIKQLKDYISVTSDWISYALIDDITDAFGPLIQSIEYEVDSIDELVLILKEAEQSDMLRRIGTCRKKVMGLLRLMGNKADVVKGLAKRCNENWSMAPKSDIGLYLSDIQDHLITMTQSLNHYEKLLSRSHSNYLAQISIEMTDANNQINDVLSRLTALGTILIPMNLITAWD